MPLPCAEIDDPEPKDAIFSHSGYTVDKDAYSNIRFQSTLLSANFVVVKQWWQQLLSNLPANLFPSERGCRHFVMQLFVWNQNRNVHNSSGGIVFAMRWNTHSVPACYACAATESRVHVPLVVTCGRVWMMPQFANDWASTSSVCPEAYQ
jgi:hypothetical protein